MFTDDEVRAWMREHFLRTLTKFNGELDSICIYNLKDTKVITYLSIY